jgi:uncharacterized protein YbjQ (UPF0145 family)
MLHGHHHDAGEPPPGEGSAMSMGSAPQPGPATGASPVTIPPAAQARLQQAAQSGAPATAFTNYSEYLMLDQMGFEPIGAVMGLSVVHLGQFQLAGIKQPVELEAYSRAISMGLLNALSRLQQEAGMLGADGVLLKSADEHSFDAEEHQYAVRGTAVRFRSQPGALRTRGNAPFVCPSPVITIYQMLKHGLAPVSMGYGVCVYHVPHRSLRQSIGQTFANTEVPVFTEGWYTGRAIALSRLQAQVEQFGADLVLNVDVREQAEAFGEHTAEFRAVGTGWAHRPGVEQLIPDIDLTAMSIIERGGLYPTTSVGGRI